jgi:cytochrome c biogenesis protein CcmG/thiol:disulfide interchange protein DsbE
MITTHERTAGGLLGLLPGQLRPYLGLACGLALLIGAVWVMEGGKPNDDTLQATSITMAGGFGGETPRVGEAAPVFQLNTLGGQPLSLADLKGHPVLMNFWASWCPPCRAEMPDLDKVAREYQGQGLVVLAVNLQEDAPTARRYAETLGLAFQDSIVLDSQGVVANRYNLTGLPTSYFIDADGIIRDWNSGGLTEKALRARLAKIVS